MVPGRRPPVAFYDPVLVPVGGAAFDLAFEEEPGDIAGMRKWDEQEVHSVALFAGGESEGGQERDGLAALFKEDGTRMHQLEAGKFLGSVAHEEPPQGTCSKNFIPSLTRSSAPGLSGVRWPSSLMTSRM